MKRKFTGLYLNSLQYFLTQPPEKALQFVQEFKLPEVISGSIRNYFNEVYNHLLYFNYLKFEDQKYLHGLNCDPDLHEKPYLLSQIDNWLFKYIKESEYEMAYELLQNLLSIKGLCKLSFPLCLWWEAFTEIVQLLMKGMADLILIRLEELEMILSEFETIAILQKFYDNIEAIFRNINKDNLVCYCLKRARTITSKIDELWEVKYNNDLGYLYFEKWNYHKAEYCFLSSLKKYDLKLLDGEHFFQLAYALRGLVLTYEQLGKIKKMHDAIKILKNMEPWMEASVQSHKILGEVYLKTNKFDQAITIFWKCLKACNKKEEMKHSTEIVQLYYLLGKAYFHQRDYAKSHKMFANAQASSKIISYNDEILVSIKIQTGLLHLWRRWYPEALKIFEEVKNYCTGFTLQELKFYTGNCYLAMLNYDKALEMYLEVKDAWSSLSENSKFNLVTIINASIGKAHYDNKNKKEAEFYFMKAFTLLDNYRYCRIDNGYSTIHTLFKYFLNRSDYNKCEIILNKLSEVIQISPFSKESLPHLYSLRLQLCMRQNNKAETENYLLKLENSFKIQIYLECPQKKIKEDEILNFIYLSTIYIEIWQTFSGSEASLIKAEKILKCCENFKNKMSADAHAEWIPNLYVLLGEICYWQFKLPEALSYFETVISLKNQYVISKLLLSLVSEDIMDIRLLLEFKAKLKVIFNK